MCSTATHCSCNSLCNSRACTTRYVEGKAEAKSRKGFFTGVATVCMKLFNMTSPHVVVLGKKDRLQCHVLIQVEG